MTAVYFDQACSEPCRRARLFGGAIFVFSPRKSTTALCELGRQAAEEAFAPLDPQEAQHSLSVEKYVSILATLKPRFIHDPRCKELIRDILIEFACDLSNIYFDVPRLRTATSNGYLQSGLAYAFKPHRDTWYSPPMCQLNWWLPIYPMEANNGMAFHPDYWNRPILNSSDEFSYQDWMQDGRKNAAQHVARDTRRQSEALEPINVEPDLRLVVEPGGLIIFSAAHLHSTVNNTSGRTRLSIDFRTVSLDDLRENRGAPNIDSACRGTTIRDYLRGTDFAHLPEDVCQMFESRDTTREVLLQEAASNCG